MTTVGRKRSFNKTDALEKAMCVFWHNGFAGTSITDLTDVLGINKPSLYAAFGNKEALFNAALEHYAKQYGSKPLKQLISSEGLPLAKRIENYLLAIVDNNTSHTLPAGCFVVKSHCESGSKSLPTNVNDALKNISIKYESLLEEFLLNEQKKGTLSKSQKPQDISAYLISLTYGISVMARSGKSSEELHAIAKTGLNAISI